MAAQQGQAHFIGQSGRGYIQSLYFDDTAGNPVRWSGGGKASATSPTEWKPSETVTLVDLVLAAATGQTATDFYVNDQGTGDVILNALHLASVTFRPRPNVKLGGKITMKQIA
jgi:hypothetical protein